MPIFKSLTDSQREEFIQTVVISRINNNHDNLKKLLVRLRVLYEKEEDILMKITGFLTLKVGSLFESNEMQDRDSFNKQILSSIRNIVNSNRDDFISIYRNSSLENTKKQAMYFYILYKNNFIGIEDYRKIVSEWNI